MKALLALVTVLAATPSPARVDLAHTDIAGRQFGPWNVYRLDKDCWMAREAPNHNTFTVSTSSDDTDLYVVIRKPEWTFIKEDDELPMRVQFTGTDATGTGSGSRGDGDLVPGAVMFLKDKSRDYIADLRHSRVVRTWLNGKPALTVDMTGAGPALDYFAKCTALIRKGG